MQRYCNAFIVAKPRFWPYSPGSGHRSIEAEALVEISTQEWLTVPEVAQELRIPRSRAYELIQRGDLPAVRVGERSIRVNRRQLEEFLLKRRQIVVD
jgi:excisionase family DNA binding protein